MTPRDANATRNRILDAAMAEFAAHGHAGGRVERIARAAKSNVRMIYAYFGNKSDLFDAALSHAIKSMAFEVPPRPLDLPAWAGDLFDYHRNDPTALRISLWAQLERPNAAREPMEEYLAKAGALATVESPPLTAIDLLVVIYAVAQAWELAPHGLLSAGDVDPKSPAAVAAHRKSAVEAVRRIVSAD